MKNYGKEDYKKRSKASMKTMLRRFQDFEDKYPEEFKKFLEDPANKRMLYAIKAY